MAVNELNTDISWAKITIPNPTVSGTTRTYSINLSSYKELAIHIFISNWGSADVRVIHTLGFNNCTYSVVGAGLNGNTSCKIFGTVKVTSSSIVVSQTESNFASTNYLRVEAVYAK